MEGCLIMEGLGRDRGNGIMEARGKRRGQWGCVGGRGEDEKRVDEGGFWAGWLGRGRGGARVR